MVGRSVFPIVFGGCLLVFGVSFYYRKTFVCESEEVIRRKQEESLKAAEEHSRKVAEGLERIRKEKLTASNSGKDY